MVRLQKLTDSAAPICSTTTNGFHFLNVNGRKVVGDTVLELDTTSPSLEFTDVTCAMDFTEDGILTSPLNDTILGSSTPPLDPIMDCTAPAPPSGNCTTERGDD